MQSVPVSVYQPLVRRVSVSSLTYLLQDQSLNYNLASEYFPDLGFYVAADGAMRLDRPLPSAALITFAPPGSFYLVGWGRIGAVLMMDGFGSGVGFQLQLGVLRSAALITFAPHGSLYLMSWVEM